MNWLKVVVEEKLKERQWSIQDLARKSKLSQHCIEKFLSGDYMMDPWEARRLAQPFGMSGRYFFDLQRREVENEQH